MSHYIITYYFPTGMFVIVSWISFLVPPESVPGRMTILVTVFLCLVNIFNSITNNIPKADGLTAIEAFIIVCIIFVFLALLGISHKRIYKYIKSEYFQNMQQFSSSLRSGQLSLQVLRGRSSTQPEMWKTLLRRLTMMEMANSPSRRCSEGMSLLRKRFLKSLYIYTSYTMS